MKWRVLYTEEARDNLRRLSPEVRNRIIRWIGKHLEGCEDPRAMGKGLTANRSGAWRYRVGDYRLIAEIDNGTVTILLLKIGHRSTVYH